MGLREMLKSIYQKIKYACITCLFYAMRIFKIKDNKIVFSSWNGGSFGDNGKYITLELLSRNKNYDILWLVLDVNDSSFPEGVRLVNIRSLRSIYELVTAKIWVDNVRKRPYVRKRKGQYYINTGHGGIPLKKVEKDASEHATKGHIPMAINDSKMMDLMTSNATFRTNILRNGYWYDGEVLECGSPKIEQLMIYDESIKRKVCKNLNINNDLHIAMYAPTFRNDHDYDYKFDFDKIKDSIEKRFGNNWVIIQRMHPILRNKNIQREDVIDASNYPDMQDLLRSCEILITDYSGTMFELLYDDEKTVFLYANDIQAYENDERGFYFKLDELPFSVASNMDELSDNIINFDQITYKNKVAEFKEQVGLIEEFGAAKAVADRIDKVIRESKSDKM